MIGLAAALVLVAGKTRAEEKVPAAIVEIGGAGEWDFHDGSSSFGLPRPSSSPPSKSGWKSKPASRRDRRQRVTE
jgi:hypothetical protein